ncbi:MAG: hypothetical protein CVV52_07685 [Spirochaetae bacterium HGW-Spirochaetae-8]|nr:MAG: hypothetical protein CVV52_07685 [Spirochaetae bacterium HGW-Spirochaetae-8]
MKKIVVVSILVGIVLTGSLFATRQNLSLGMWGDAYNLRDIPNTEALEYSLYPYLKYDLGDVAQDALTLYMQVGLPYVIGDGLDTLFPDGSLALNYRIRSESSDAFINTGLTSTINRYSTPDTVLANTAYLYWYPFNKAQEVYVDDRYYEFIDGIRFGFGLDAGADLGYLFEDPEIETVVHGALVGRMLAGAQLSDRIWLSADLRVQTPGGRYFLENETYTLGFDSELSMSLAFMGSRFQAFGGMDASLNVADVYTQDGFLDGTEYSYDFMLWGELAFFIIEDLNVYAGVEFTGSRGSLDDELVAYVGLQYFFL